MEGLYDVAHNVQITNHVHAYTLGCQGSCYLRECTLTCLVVLTVEFRLQPAALTNIPDALYMEYALWKR